MRLERWNNFTTAFTERGAPLFNTQERRLGNTQGPKQQVVSIYFNLQTKFNICKIKEIFLHLNNTMLMRSKE